MLLVGWQLRSAAAVVLSASLAPTSAFACAAYLPPRLTDVSLADVVVIGRIENYRIVRDEAFRRERLAWPKLTADMRKAYEDPEGSLIPDYASFGVQVEKVLFGRAPSSLPVTWDNSTFGEPEEMRQGRYVLALRWPRSPAPPLRGPSATISPSPEAGTMTVLQAPCSSAFIYKAESAEGQIIQFLLGPAARSLSHSSGEPVLYGGREQQLISVDDYPPDALSAGAEGLTAVKMAMGADGRPVDCAVIRSSGSVSLDRATCTLLKQRFRRVRSVGPNGKPLANHVRLSHFWVLPRAGEDGRDW
ncbi:energy transducer TonB [Sphingomonas sp. ID0503]|uniref:energy transducer TonB n=1 Tax=Sphingomonas sp. ID0503 TaxID=3399691 RepID=UPI003AFAE347